MSERASGDRTRPRKFLAPLGLVLGGGATLAGAILWLAGPFLPFAPPVHAWLLAASGGLGVAGLAAAALGARSRAGLVLAALGVVLAAAFFGLLLGPVRPSARGLGGSDPQPAPRRSSTLRVLSYNVLHGYPRFTGQDARVAALARALERLDPDVVLLQEAWCTKRHGCLLGRLAAERAPLHGYHLAYAPVNGSLRLIGFEEGLAVASRWPIERIRTRALSPRERPWRRRAALEVAIHLDGEPWTFITAHLADRDGTVREAQALSLAAGLPAPGPLVLGADLNDPPGSPTLGALEARGLEAVLGGARDHVLLHDLPVGWTVADARWLFAPEDASSPSEPATPISDHPAAWVELVRADSGARLQAPMPE